MVLEGVLDAVGRLSKANSRNDDDLPDRVNHRYTVIFVNKVIAIMVIKPLDDPTYRVRYAVAIVHGTSLQPANVLHN